MQHNIVSMRKNQYCIVRQYDGSVTYQGWSLFLKVLLLRVQLIDAAQHCQYGSLYSVVRQYDRSVTYRCRSLLLKVLLHRDVAHVAHYILRKKIQESSGFTKVVE